MSLLLLYWLRDLFTLTFDLLNFACCCVSRHQVNNPSINFVNLYSPTSVVSTKQQQRNNKSTRRQNRTRPKSAGKMVTVYARIFGNTLINKSRFRNDLWCVERTSTHTISVYITYMGYDLCQHSCPQSWFLHFNPCGSGK